MRGRFSQGAIHLAREIRVGFAVFVAERPAVMFSLENDIELFPGELIAAPVAAIVHSPQLAGVGGKFYADRVPQS